MAEVPIANDQNRNRLNLAKQPTVFSLKQNFPTWFKQFRNFCDLCQIPENNRYRTLLSFLDQEAFLLVENLALTQQQRADIQANAVYILIKNALKSTDSRVPPGYELRFRRQKENESIEQYALALETLALDAYPNEQNIRQNRLLIESFISGIRSDELAIKLLQNDFANLTEAIEMAKQYFQALQTRRFIKTEADFRPSLEKVYNISTEEKHSESVNNVSNQVPQAKPVPNQAGQSANQNLPNTNNGSFVPQNFAPWNQQYVPNPDPRQVMYNNAGFNQFYPSFQDPNAHLTNQQPGFNNLYQMRNNIQRPRQKANVICYFCFKPGHYSNECFKNPAASRLPPRNKVDTCSYCGKRGHKAENCWFLTGQKEPNDNDRLAQMNSKNPFRPT